LFYNYGKKSGFYSGILFDFEVNDSKLSSIVEVKRFLQESEVIEFKKRFRKEAYQ
jgi:hypothetical protein